MPRNYFKLDLYFFEHPKAVDLSHSATVLFLASIAYANRRETDGFIARPVARKLIDLDPEDHYVPPLKELIGELERVVLWEPVEGGWQIHDFFDHNDSSEERAEKRAGERDRKRRQRAGKAPSGHVTAGQDVTSESVPRDMSQRPNVSRPIEVEVTEAEAESTATPRAELALVTPPADTAQTILGAYIDWRREQGINGFDGRTKGQLAKHLRQAFDGGHQVEAIKLGLRNWHYSDQHPATLPSFIDSAARGGMARASPGKTQRQLDDIQRTYQQMQAMGPPGGGDNGDLGRLDRQRGQAQRELS